MQDKKIYLCKTMMNEFIKEVSKVYGQIYAKVRKLNVKGGVKFPISKLKANFQEKNKKFYLCDPKKNKQCKKYGCQEFCVSTSNKKARASIWKYIKSYLKGFPIPPC